MEKMKILILTAENSKKVFRMDQERLDAALERYPAVRDLASFTICRTSVSYEDSPGWNEEDYEKFYRAVADTDAIIGYMFPLETFRESPCRPLLSLQFLLSLKLLLSLQLLLFYSSFCLYGSFCLYSSFCLCGSFCLYGSSRLHSSSRISGMLMHLGPPLPRDSSALGISKTSIPFLSRILLVM